MPTVQATTLGAKLSLMLLHPRNSARLAGWPPSKIFFNSGDAIVVVTASACVREPGIRQNTAAQAKTFQVLQLDSGCSSIPPKTVQYIQMDTIEGHL